MGCGCGKKKTGVTPMSAAQAKAPRPQTVPTSPTPAIGHPGLPDPRPAQGTTQSFALVQRDGTTTMYGSRLEADAENVRLGYTGTVKTL